MINMFSRDRCPTAKIVVLSVEIVVTVPRVGRLESTCTASDNKLSADFLIFTLLSIMNSRRVMKGTMGLE
jgi:hypothetical protein